VRASARGKTARPPPTGSLVVNFIDVGQGAAILVQSVGKNYLVDGGKTQAGPEVVDFLLRSRGVGTLDGLVATHPDSDHIRRLPDVLDAFDVATVCLSGDPKWTSTFNAFLRDVRDEGS
jgi:beta-lactamase superfamily II metal-dependent hydrolase